MLIYLGLGIALVFTAALSFITVTGMNQAQTDITSLREADVREVGRAVRIYFDKYSTPPASLEELSQEPGNEFVKKFIQMPHVGFAVSPSLTDSLWSYQRVTVFAQDPASAVPVPEYLNAENNSCGTADFNSADSWCGNKNSKWYRFETREVFGEQMTRQRLRQHNTVQKMAVGYNDAGQFPIMGQAANSIANIVGYSGDASNCSAIFIWNNVPIDCTDLFSVWGSPVVVNRLTNQTVALLSRTPMINVDGEPVSTVTIMPLDIE